MEQLLNPDKRMPKMLLTSEEISVRVAPTFGAGEMSSGLSLRVPKGTPAILLNSLRYKDLIQDIVLVGRDSSKLDAKYGGLLPADKLSDLKEGLFELRA